jgi:hypothetical protein
MALRNATKTRVSLEHNRYIMYSPDDVRRRALVRLYERRFAVDNLIRALERYQQEQSGPAPKLPPVSVGGTWW